MQPVQPIFSICSRRIDTYEEEQAWKEEKGVQRTKQVE